MIKQIGKTVFIVSSILFTLNIQTFAQNHKHISELEGFSEFILQQMEEWKVPGCAVAIVRNGKVRLANLEGTPLVQITIYNACDRLLNLKPIAWEERFKNLLDRFRNMTSKSQRIQESDRKERSQPSHPLQDYEGSYEHSGYGILNIKMQGNQLVAKLNSIELPLIHYQYDVFEIGDIRYIVPLTGKKVLFIQDQNGDIARVTIPLEPQVKDIEFRRILGKSLLSTTIPQKVDEIMARYYQAMGGLENLRTWKGMYARAKYILSAQGGVEVPTTVWYKAPDKTRVEMHLEQGDAIYVVTGECAWVRDPSRGFPEPSYMPEDQARAAMSNADVYPFIDYQQKGHRIEYLGTEEFEGANVYKIKLIQKTGAESIHLLDANNGRELKIIIKARQQDKETIYETIERDFRKVDWLLLPFTTESQVNKTLVRKMVIEDVELDPEIDDSLFQFPVKKKGKCN